MPTHRRVTARPLALVCLLLVSATAPAAADTHTWDGSASTLWSAATNWQEGIAPVDGDDLVFPAGAANLTNVNDIVGLDVNSITLGNAFYILTGNSINLAAAGLTSNTLVCCQTLTLPIVLGGATTVDVQVFSLDVSGTVSGAGGWTKTGPGIFNLNNAHTYSGVTTISAGILQINNSSGLGSTANGTVVQTGGQLSIAGAIAVGAEALTLNGTGTGPGGAALGSAQLISSWAGNITLASDASIGPSGDPALAVLTLSGTLTGPGNLTTKNGGTVIYTGSSPAFTEPITVTGGRLLVNGDLSAAPVSVDKALNASAAVLGGTGSVSTTSVQTAGGTVAPGASPGVLSSGSLTFSNSSSDFAVELNGTTVGTQYDRLAVTGTASLANATLNATVGYVPVVGDSFTILTTTAGVSGTFNGLADLATFVASGRTLQIDYTATSVVLTVTSLVPVELQSFEVD